MIQSAGGRTGIRHFQWRAVDRCCPVHHMPVGTLQRTQALGMVGGEQCQVAVMEAAGGHAGRCGTPGPLWRGSRCRTGVCLRQQGLLFCAMPGSTVEACTLQPALSAQPADHAHSRIHPVAPRPAVEAMRLYVRTLEEELPDWWALHTAAANGSAEAADSTPPAANGVAGSQPAAAGSSGTPAAAAAATPPLPKTRSVAEVVVEGSWVSPYISSDKRPPPRYEHATALIGSELFVIGGNYGGLCCPPPLVPCCSCREACRPSRELLARRQQNRAPCRLLLSLQTCGWPVVNSPALHHQASSGVSSPSRGLLRSSGLCTLTCLVHRHRTPQAAATSATPGP